MKNRYFLIRFLRLMLIHKGIPFLHDLKPLIQQVNALQNILEIGLLGRSNRLQHKMNFSFRAWMFKNTNLIIPSKDLSIPHIAVPVFHCGTSGKQMKVNLLDLLIFSAVCYQFE